MRLQAAWDGRNETVTETRPLRLLVGKENGAATGRARQFLKKLNIHFYDPAIPVL